MWSPQKALSGLRSGGGAVLDLLYQRQISQYLPLESRGGLYIPNTQHTGDSKPFWKRSTPRRAFWATLAAVTLFVLFSSLRPTYPTTAVDSKPSPYVPEPLVSSGPHHPIIQLVRRADGLFQSVSERQSKSLPEAVAEYRQRYQMPPPPHFEKWYYFAVEQGTHLIDEYDSIYDSLLPFWALKPEVLRARTVEALGHDNSLMGVSIRNGEVCTIGSGQDEFQTMATQEMISAFSNWLPDLDLAFNVNDEPRVLIPHEDIDRMTLQAKQAIASINPSRSSLDNQFTRPQDMGDGTGYPRVSETRFNRLDRQQTWSHSRMSCAADTPARTLDGTEADTPTTFAFEDLWFVYNISSFSDVCLSPSLRQRIGLFNHPNAYAVSHDLIPIFSPSKLSTFHDILYPSPYYYADKTQYDAGAAVSWEEKIPKLYWRGATSGGYSVGGTWRTLLRQSVLAKLMSPGTVKVLHRDGAGRIDMLRVFGHHDHVPQEESWKQRYLLDMDGNALSGRFYALLKSQSLPFKLAYFREWHAERLFAWKDYVPVSAGTDEYAEILRFFEEEDEGKTIAKQLADQGRDWANQVVRKEDMEVYMFRLLLEYGRLVDDNRDRLGWVP